MEELVHHGEETSEVVHFIYIVSLFTTKGLPRVLINATFSFLGYQASSLSNVSAQNRTFRNKVKFLLLAEKRPSRYFQQQKTVKRDRAGQFHPHSNHLHPRHLVPRC